MRRKHGILGFPVRNKDLSDGSFFPAAVYRHVQYNRNRVARYTWLLLPSRMASYNFLRTYNFIKAIIQYRVSHIQQSCILYNTY
jgi:hypothetical protein